VEQQTDLTDRPDPSALDASSASISRTSLSTLAAFHRRPGIRRRFIVAISLLVALVLAAQAAVVLLFGYQDLQRTIEQRAAAYATLAVEPISDAFVKYHESGHSKFQELVASVIDLNPDVDELAIYDIDQKVLWHSSRLDGDAQRRPRLLLESPDGRLPDAVRGLELRSWHEGGAGPQRHFVVVAPYVEEWGRHQYSVVFRFGYASLRAAIFEMGWRVLLLGLFGLALGVACAVVLSRQSLRPVERLIRGAQELARGHLGHRIELRSGDELEVLGATVDQMAALLEKTIADLETSNRRLATMNQELQELDKVKSDLLANVSHELRTPLTAISGYVEALHAGLLGALGPGQKEVLAVVGRNVGRLRGMIDQLLSYSRIESGRLQVEMRSFDLEAAARLVVEAVRAAHGRQHEVKIEPHEDLPEVYGDASRISQVIENLLTNAVKFSPPGSTVDLRLRVVGDGVEVRVRDRGIGIAPEVHDKIFDRFYQVDATSKRHFGGMGLGLAIVREILELHNSRIVVESRPGEGASFRFALPIAAERTGLVPTATAPRVVFVDDDAVFVQRASTLLGEAGYVVHGAATAEQGLALIYRLRPDLVVLDRLLPDCDGFDLLKQLKDDAKTRALPIVLCTVRKEKALGLRLGAADFWTKPIDGATLVERVKALAPLDVRTRAAAGAGVVTLPPSAPEEAAP
jgi:signal transduction histidine kinase/CheY-like chemotaxis protein